jgi:peptide/nickel transport system substrate-binding protein
MGASLRLLAGAAVVALGVGGGGGAAVRAETPDGVLVMADFIDDMISLDPAEAYEFSGLEAVAQLYDRIMTYPVDNVADLKGLVAESWSVSDDGKVFTLKIRDGIKFHSGNPLTAKDVEYSLRRVVGLNKSPGFILTQFGFSAENMGETVKATDDRTLVLTLAKPVAPTFLLYCLTSGVGSVVDSKVVEEHATGGDYGYAWLKTNSAASGPFKLRSWKPNENWSADANPDYWQGAPTGFKRVIVRHVPETGTQRLLLEKGDIDIARKLTPEDLAAVGQNPDVTVQPSPKGALWYMGLNQKNPNLARPEVREALKWLVDYDAIVGSVAKGKRVHQTILPVGFVGALDEKPYRLDVAKAKELLAKAGLPDGFSVTMDVRNNSPTKDIAQAVQSMWAQAGVNVELIPADNKQTLTKYRARTHDIYIGQWGPDYQDPHTNADGFLSNTDNSDEGKGGVLAWRNAYKDDALTGMVQAAVVERDGAKRVAMYEEIQRKALAVSPYVIMAQDVEFIAARKNVKGMIWGPSFDDHKYWKGTKE